MRKGSRRNPRILSGIPSTSLNELPANIAVIDLLPRFLQRGTISYLWPVAVVILATPIGLVVVLMSVKNPTIGTNLVGPMLWFGAIVIGAALGAILWMKSPSKTRSG